MHKTPNPQEKHSFLIVKCQTVEEYCYLPGVLSESRGQWCVAIIPHEYKYKVTKKQWSEQGGGGCQMKKLEKASFNRVRKYASWCCTHSRPYHSVSLQQKKKDYNVKKKTGRVMEEEDRLKNSS